MSTPDSLPTFVSQEDQFDAAVKAMEGTKEPAEAAPAPEATPQPASDVPRDEQGRFAPRADGQQGASQEAPQAEREPFDGFSTLPPDAQDRIRAILGQQEQLRKERDSFRNRFSRANNDLLTLRRSQQRPNTGTGQQPHPASGTGREAQPGIAQARAEVAAMPAGAERNAANQKLDAWEKHAKEYPDDAAAIQQLVGALRDDLIAGIAPRLQELEQLREQLNGFRSLADELQTERQTRRNQEAQSTLDDLAPGWRYFAGWEDAEGNEVPRGERQWSGEMQAWLEGHDPEVRAVKLQQLGHGSPHVAAEVFQQFLADYQAVTQGQHTQAPNPVAARRAQNLRDVVPGGAGTGKPSTPAWRQGSSPEDEFDAVSRFVESRRNTR